MFYTFLYFYILFTVFCFFLFSLCSVCFYRFLFFCVLAFFAFFLHSFFYFLFLLTLFDLTSGSLCCGSSPALQFLCFVPYTCVCALGICSVLVLLFVSGFVSSFLFCCCCCYYLFISSPFVLSFLWFHHLPYFFSFFCHTVWLARSWLPSQGLSLSLWGGSAKPRILHQQRMPSSREY